MPRKSNCSVKHAQLDSPEETEKYILSLDKTNKYKQTLLLAYFHYCKANGINWVPPRLKGQSAPIVIPTQERIDRIISSGNQKWVAIFSISKHGLRPDEVSKITLRDVDLERGLLTVRTSKLGAERTIKLKEYALENLRTHIQRRNIERLDTPIFPVASRLRVQWNRHRRRAYLNFRDTELLKIRHYDLRHWFATTEYIKTRDLLHVKYLLGHRNIQSTLIYVHLAQGLINTTDDYTCKAARTVEETCKLIEAGFDYVTEIDGAKLFRKRK
jgi:integrase